MGYAQSLWIYLILTFGIVVVPGHAFLAWRKERDGDWDFLETVLVGTQAFGEAHKAGAAAYASFVASGQAKIHDIAQLRKDGYFPLL